MKAWRLLYPFLFALAPVVHLGAHNADQIDPGQISAAAGLAVLGSVVVFAGLFLLGRDAHRAALCTAATVVAFFAYGGLYLWLLGRRVLDDGLPLHAVTTLVSGGLLFTAGRFIWRTRRPLETVGAVLSVAAAVFVGISIFTLGRSGKLGVTDDPYAAWVVPMPPTEPRPATPSVRPDIYYIILDGYARADVLEELYGFDNRPFLAELEKRGFWVGAHSRSNYPTTFQSLASSLNMRYLDEDLTRLRRELGAQTKERGPFEAQIRDPLVARMLRTHGYRYATVLTSWSGTERSRAADVTWAYSPILGREFYGVLIDRTPLRVLSPRVAEMHQFTLARLAEVPDLDGPTFAFLHLLMPHNPYVFDRHGNEIAGIPASMQFKIKTGGWRRKNAYLEQLQYLNGRILAVLDSISARSQTPPVIVLQADHGSATTAYAPENKGVPLARERLAILNALLVPEGVRSRLYDTITPVNTFRLLLGELFGADLPLLPDRSFIAWYRRPYELVEVTPPPIEARVTPPAP